MAHRDVLLARLAVAREVRARKTEHRTNVANKTAPKPVAATPTQAADSPPSDPTRHLAAECAKMAMVAGWDKAIQKTAYENDISEQRMKDILDEAAAYNDKADPAGRIDELRDWVHQKRRPEVQLMRNRQRP